MSPGFITAALSRTNPLHWRLKHAVLSSIPLCNYFSTKFFVRELHMNMCIIVNILVQEKYLHSNR